MHLGEFVLHPYLWSKIPIFHEAQIESQISQTLIFIEYNVIWDKISVSLWLLFRNSSRLWICDKICSVEYSSAIDFHLQLMDVKNDITHTLQRAQSTSAVNVCPSMELYKASPIIVRRIILKMCLPSLCPAAGIANPVQGTDYRTYNQENDILYPAGI